MSRCNDSIDGDCGCNKIDAAEVIYQGPDLTCIGVNNCDDLATVLTTLNIFFCSVALAETILETIQNNPVISANFATAVNEAISCETVLACNII